MSGKLKILFICLAVSFQLSASAHAGDRLRLSSTTSTDNTGLLEYLLPIFREKTGITVDVIAVGTGKALKLAENGDVDVTLVHAPKKEMEFVKKGFGVNRRKIMANYFIIVGPPKDPARAQDTATAVEAFEKISRSGATFISRGDGSGTNIKELAIWKAAKVGPQGSKWYLESGKGMGETLTMTDEKEGYTLADRGSFLKFGDKVDLVPVFSKRSPLLFNPYSIMAVNPKIHPYVDFKGAMKLIDFMSSPEGQKLIGDFRDKRGERMFEPLAGKN